MSVGYDHIDLDAADDRDITVGHTLVSSAKRLPTWVGRS